MSIQAKDVQRGWLFRTPNNQERIVLGFNTEKKVVYAIRGGNVGGPFSVRNASSIERFIDKCSERLEQYSDEQMERVKVQCNAQNLTLTTTL
ncbi:hypothetical protein [Acinetobacter sp. 1125_18A]|uniref:hypothetical protein n=1 Tax=Acinetobacter sp. 1125_18A TaxID=2605959 RepID=UPI0040593657